MFALPLEFVAIPSLLDVFSVILSLTVATLSFGAFAQSPVPGRGQLLVASALENHLYSTNVNAGIITSIDMQVKEDPFSVFALPAPWLLLPLALHHCFAAKPSLCTSPDVRPPNVCLELDMSLHKPCWPYFATFRPQLRTPIAELFIHVV